MSIVCILDCGEGLELMQDSTTVLTVRRNATASTVTERSTKTITSPLCVTDTKKETVTVEDRQMATVTVTETTTDTTSTTELTTTTNVRTITLPSTYRVTAMTTRSQVEPLTPALAPAKTIITVTKTTTRVSTVVTATRANQNRRHVPQCTPKTTIATKLPAYATGACWARLAYSSACSCLSITRRTTTLPRRTVTQMTTSTSTVRPTTTIVQETTVAGDCRETVTLTDTEPSTTTITETKTAFVGTITTATTTTTEAIETETFEFYLDGTVTQTIRTIETLRPTACPLQQVGGPNNSPPRYLRVGKQANPIVWTTDINQANYFYVDPLDDVLRTNYARVLGYESWGPVYGEGSYVYASDYLRNLRCSFSTSHELSCRWDNRTDNGVFGIPKEQYSGQYVFFGYTPYTGSNAPYPVGLVRACPTYQATITTTTTVTEWIAPTSCPLKQVGGGTFGDGGVNFDGTYLRNINNNVLRWYPGYAEASSFFLDGDSLLAHYAGSLVVGSDIFFNYPSVVSSQGYDPEANYNYAMRCAFLPNATSIAPELKCVTVGPGGNNDFKRIRHSPENLGWSNASDTVNGFGISVKIVRACPWDEV